MLFVGKKRAWKVFPFQARLLSGAVSMPRR
jgi:hypothetical protein